MVVNGFKGGGVWVVCGRCYVGEKCLRQVWKEEEEEGIKKVGERRTKKARERTWRTRLKGWVFRKDRHTQYDVPPQTGNVVVSGIQGGKA